jgi:hypothetical protein
MPKRSAKRVPSDAQTRSGDERHEIIAASSNPYLWITFLLILAVLLPYTQVIHFDFVSFDDPDSEKALGRKGSTRGGTHRLRHCRGSVRHRSRMCCCSHKRLL